MVKTEIIDLKGVITVTERDRRGIPLEIGIETDDFLTYVITCKRKGKELFKHISRKAAISCLIEGKNYFGNPLISVVDYSIIE
jgi:hypothetical protein